MNIAITINWMKRLAREYLFVVACTALAWQCTLAWANPADTRESAVSTAAFNPLEVGTRRVVTLGALPLHYQDMGDPQAPTVVFLHGAGGIRSTGRVGPLLAEQHYHVLIPSIPGFDDTPRGTARTLADVVEVLAQFIERASRPPVFVVGQSLGGRTASWLAIVHPELVRKLVLSAPATFAAHAPQLPSDNLAAKRMLAKLLLGDADAASQISAEQLASQRATMQLLSDYMSNPNRQMFLARLSQITRPTLLLWGKQDRVLQADEGPPLFTERLRDLKVVYLDGPHLLPATNAPEYVEATTQFLSN